jgi:hypothetical protein
MLSASCYDAPAMWIIIGNRNQTQEVPGGRETRRECPKCHTFARMSEHRVLTTFRLYFVDILNHGARHLMVCNVCGTAFATDELASKQAELTQEGTVVGSATKAFQQARDATMRGPLGAAVRRTRTAIDSGAVGEQVEEAVKQTQEAVRALFTKKRQK